MKRTEKKHRAIVKIAKNLFLKQGFSSTSMDQIALEAGVSKMTLYHHFPNKTQLFHTVISEHWRLTIQAEEVLFDTTKSPAENLKFFAIKLLDFLTQKKTLDFLRLLIAEAKQFPDLSKALVTEEAGPFTQQLIDYLKQEVEKGQLIISDPELAGYQFLGLIKERLFWLKLFGISSKDTAITQKTIEKAIEIFLLYYKNNSSSSKKN